ncbi:MAG: DNA helicase PcrA [Bacillota bacterium]|nr:DNA helicase PcrA [Bacillota bacterium]
MNLKELLNKEQYEAVVTTEGPLLILAGAGSGKTRVLTYRIAHLINDLKVYPSQILAITFTNKAAGEMRERVKALVGDEADRMWVSTFHSSCVRILRREIDKLGYEKNFSIYDTSDQKTLIKQCMKELNINEKDIEDKEIIKKISRQKDNLISPEQFKTDNEKNYRMNKIADVYLLYQKKLKSNNALDFDDLIYKTVELFRKNPDVLEFYRRKFEYILVDEYQDTNKSQYEFSRILAESHKNICVVGDDDQCIYEFRGADIRNILDFEKDYPEAKVVKLEQNYRSVGNILDAANSVISNNTDRKSKVLRTDSEAGEKVKVYRAFSDIDEGNFVANQIKRMVEEGYSNSDFAVLYRTNAQSRIFEECFVRQSIPYKLVGGLGFYDRKEIKDILAYLRLIVNFHDDISLLRIINVPKRSIGNSTIDKMQEFANSIDDCLYNVILDIENVPGIARRSITSISKFAELINSLKAKKDMMSVSELLQAILDETGYVEELKNSNEIEYQSRSENIEQLISAAVEFENSSEDKSAEAFLETVALVAAVDSMDEKSGNVVLMTFHSAKGLEFPVVFMVGMENGLFPSSLAFNNDKEMEESRRLCYVGITRARKKLFMTSAEVRRVYGRTVGYEESEFLNEIPKELKEHLNGIGKSYNSYSGGQIESKRVTYNMNNEYNNTNSIKKTNYNNSIIVADLIKNDDVKSEVKNEVKSEVKKLTNSEATIGRKIKHAKFGIGTIISINKDGRDIKLTIAFDNMGIKTFLLGLAPLELL